MLRKKTLITSLILLFLGGGIIFLMNNYFEKNMSQNLKNKREYIVVKAFGAVHYLQPLIFRKKLSVFEIISVFDLHRNANLQAVFYRKNKQLALLQENLNATQKWIKTNLDNIVYEDVDFKIGFF